MPRESERRDGRERAIREVSVAAAADHSCARQRGTAQRRGSPGGVAPVLVPVVLATLMGCAGGVEQASPAASGHDAAPSAPAPSTSSSDVPATSGDDVADLCRRALPDEVLLAWTGGTVGGFRSWQHGGPTPDRPLVGAFADLADDVTGAWCGVRHGDETIRWLAVVGGHDPARVIDVTGPGETSPRGEVDRPPTVP